ncbi:MAG TPA: tetratricopeptide repeat protein [bacterium]|nr:tetratricopeptide repeat protein [bacterium]
MTERLVSSDFRRDAKLLLALILVALAARVLYAFDYSGSPLYHFPIIDAGYHSFLARLGSEGAALPGGPYFKPPLYVWFLTDLYSSAGGKSLVAAHIFNTLLGLGIVALTFLWGKKLFGRTPAFAAALFVALYDLGPFFEEQALSVTLETLTYLVSLALFVNAWEEGLDWEARRGRLIWAGIALGFGALARPNLLLFLPVAAALGLFYGLRDENYSWKRALAAALIPLGLALAVILPATLHNLFESGKFVLVSANGGVNFFIGNGPEADGFSSVPPGMAWRRLAGDSDLGGAGGLADGSYWYARGLDAVFASPGRAIGLFFKKALGFFNAADVSSNVNIGWARGQSLWLRFNPLRWWLAAPFGLAGLVTALGRDRGRMLANPGAGRGLTILVAFAVTYIVGVVAFFVTSRYRMPLLPVMALLGAGFVAHLIRMVRDKKARLSILPWVLLLVCLGLTLAPVVPAEDGFSGEFYAGLALEKRGLSTEALVLYNRALEIHPDDAETYQRRGAVRGRLGDAEGRLEDFRRAVEIAPDYADALYDLAALLQRTGTSPPEEYLSLYSRAVEADPDFIPARMAYGMALRALGRYDDAAGQFEEAVNRRPRFSAAHRLLGKVYEAQGRLPEAAREFFLADYFGGEIWSF